MRVDVVQLAADVMAQRGYPVVRRDGLLEHPDSGFAITPVLLDTYPAGPLVHSTTTVTTSHPRLVPQGVFEYQHARDKTLADAVRDGFDQWVQLDFAVLLDALRDPLEYCQGIEITFPQIDGPDLRRRACPRSDRTCCPVPGMSGSRRRASLLPVLLPDQHIDAFRPLMESNRFYGIRFYAARGDDGAPLADCRVNGEDWEDGKRALLGYVDKWPQAGLELRKQYIVMQTLAAP
jgi:hypothetical protein